MTRDSTLILSTTLILHTYIVKHSFTPLCRARVITYNFSPSPSPNTDMASAVTALSRTSPIVASAPINTSYSYANTSNGLKQVHGQPLCSSNIKLVGNGKKRVVVMMGKNAGLAALSLALPAAMAMAMAMVIPEMAEAAAPGVSPSLNNFLFSIASGSVVLGAIGVAVIGVSSFDPVKRN